MSVPLQVASPAQPRRWSNRRIIFWILATPILALALPVLLSLFLGPRYFDVLWVLGTGWVGFLLRTLPRITANWDLLGMGLLCTLAILFGGQWVLRTLVNSVATARGWNWRWRWKWTISVVIGLALMFLVGMAVGGATHQIGWLSSQPGPWYERKGEDYLELRNFDLELRNVLLDSTGDVTQIRAELSDPENRDFYWIRSSHPALQRFHVLLIMEGSNNIEGAIIFSRDVKKRDRTGCAYSFRDESEWLVPAARLPQLIRKHQGHLVAL